ncbi:MAG: hypothetical protein JWP81_5126 [Ferruginibacter sp.]|nr:hypothetical protein [Ferruginibacter sp.]
MVLAILDATPKFALSKEILNTIGLWCNGSTTDFDSVSLGSKPGNPTKIEKGNRKGCLFCFYGMEVCYTLYLPGNQRKQILAESENIKAE